MLHRRSSLLTPTKKGSAFGQGDQLRDDLLDDILLPQWRVSQKSETQWPVQRSLVPN